MKRCLRYVALAVVVGTGLLWVSRGANLGWTKTTVPVVMVDEVTGLQGVEYQDRFVPGLDVVAAGVALGGLLVGLSFVNPGRNRNH